MEWQTDEFADQHDGRPAAVLPDGSERHITDVEARTVPLPAGLAALLAEVDEELEHLADEAPLAALRAIGALERTTSWTARTAAYNIKADEVPAEQVAAGLGMSERSAASRLSHYHYRH